MRRILSVALVVGVVAIAAALWWALRSLDGYVEDAIERVGSELLGTHVSVGGVSIDLRAGRGTVRDIRVANPEGFADADAFSVEEVVLGIELESVTRSPIVLTEVSVRSPEVLAEANAAGLNLNVLRRNVSSSSADEADAEVASEGGEPRRLRIARLDVAEAQARSDTTALGGKLEEIPVPGLSLRDVGGADGATPGEIGKRVLDAWLARIAAAAAKHQAKRAFGEVLDDALGEEKEKVGEALKGLFD